MTPPIAKELFHYIREFQPRTELRNGEWFLLLPGFDPIGWRAPIKRKLFSRRNRNAVFYEETATAALSYLFQSTDCKTFLDVGAQWGYFSTLALNYQARPIAVYAYEINPVPTQYFVPAIEAAREKGRTCKLVFAGLSDEHLGDKDIWVSVTKMFEHEPDPSEFRDPWYSRLKFALRGRKDRDLPQKVRVLITSLDHICATENIAPDIIKIDVDGYEAKVIPGGMAVFAQHKPALLLELHKKKFYSRFNVTRREIVSPLFDLGYQALLLEDHHDRNAALHPIGVDDKVINREETDMFLFWHPERLT